MSIVNLNDIHIAFGPLVVLDKLNLELHPKEKVGMVGVNGSGKSTILKLIIEQVKPDIGKVIIKKGLRIGYLPQGAAFDGDRTVLEVMYAGVEHILKIQQKIAQTTSQMEVLSGQELDSRMKQYDRLCHEFETAGGYSYQSRMMATLKGLGFEEHLHNVKTSALSGGQLSRLGLAQVLMPPTDLLLLDEPTNHLDIQGTEWLERFLAGYDGAGVVISHDRRLLDKVACKIIEVRGGQATVWKGNYSNYVSTSEIIRLQEQRQHQQRVEMVERTLDFIARNKDQEGMRKTARGRKTRLKRLLKENPDFLEKPTSEKTISFSFSNNDKGSDLVLRCENLTKSFDKLVLFKNLSFDILRSERVGITGPNGTGKTTLLRMALGEMEPTEGVIRLGRNLRLGYLDQHGDVLDPARSVLEEALISNPAMTSEQARNKLGSFLFTGEDCFKVCADLSGGQRNRLMLCKLVLTQPDVLLMDEPTNHLDIASRQAMEAALADYGGTIIVVSHDRYFLDMVADRLIVVGMDEAGHRAMGKTVFVETRPVYSQYEAMVQRTTEDRIQKKEDRLKTQDSRLKTQDSRPKTHDTRVKIRQKTPEELKRFNKYSIEQLEDMITALEKELKELGDCFGQAMVYKNPDRLAELRKDFDAKTAELELLYRAYEYRTE
jgi:ATP-binding cassette, subfamily F, member 3